MVFLAAIPGLASATVKACLDTLFPPRCYACARITGGLNGVCAKCWADISFISAPCCARCGVPFPHEMGSATVECMPCLTQPPRFEKARAVFCYDGASRRLITRYKYHDQTHATPMFSQWLHRAGMEMLAESDLIIPVPLHRWRMMRRRYNQSALLAAGVAKLSDKPWRSGILLRVRATAQQAGLNREQRLQNVTDAFAVRGKAVAGLQGKKVLLVDDVLTTGATLDACTKALLDAGVSRVYLLTLARTVNEEI